MILDVRDIEAAFTDESGHCVLIRAAVSAVAERLWATCHGFASRDLAAQRALYLFVHSVAERLSSPTANSGLDL